MMRLGILFLMLFGLSTTTPLPYCKPAPFGVRCNPETRPDPRGALCHFLPTANASLRPCRCSPACVSDPAVTIRMIRPRTGQTHTCSRVLPSSFPVVERIVHGVSFHNGNRVYLSPNLSGGRASSLFLSLSPAMTAQITTWFSTHYSEKEFREAIEKAISAIDYKSIIEVEVRVAVSEEIEKFFRTGDGRRVIRRLVESAMTEKIACFEGDSDGS